MMSRQRALIYPPGEQYRYSNTAYMLLAQVLERAGGKSLGEITEERIFEPLGMEGSLMYENLEGIIPRRATGYDRDADGRLRIVHNYNFDVAGDGQLYSTVEDLLCWNNYLHGAEKPAIYSMMLTEGHLNNGEPTGYAQGIRLYEYRGLRTVGHHGSSWGFRTQLVRFVEQVSSRASPRESRATAAARRPPSFRETAPRVGVRPRVLGHLIQDFEGLEAVAGPRETGDSYPVAPLRFQTLLDMEEPETSAGPSTHRSRRTRTGPEDERSQPSVGSSSRTRRAA